MVNFTQTLKEYQDWYIKEKNTSALIRNVFSNFSSKSLTGDVVWNLIRLTWITSYKGETSEDYWRTLKIPALASLFNTRYELHETLKKTLGTMSLPEKITTSANADTGFVNYRNVWRNSLKDWCQKHVHDLNNILELAYSLNVNDQKRFDLAKRVDKFKGVPSPNGGSIVGASSTLTPLLACLDPLSRFPVINAREGVSHLIRSLRLSNASLEDQVKGMINLIGQFGIPDSFGLDVLADNIAENAGKIRKARPTPKLTEKVETSDGAQLDDMDEDERIAVAKSRTTVYRNRHNKMTNALKRFFGSKNLKRGDHKDCRYDALYKNYDNSGRDLLIEVKPDVDKGSIRIAIGQLFDYRRFLEHRAGTDLAFLSITPPSKSHIELLLDLQISALWFDNEKCNSLSGVGKVVGALGLPKRQIQ